MADGLMQTKNRGLATTVFEFVCNLRDGAGANYLSVLTCTSQLWLPRAMR